MASAIAVLTGCATNDPPSEQWLKAQQSDARQEMAYTNGMEWPANAVTNETVMPPGMRIKVRTSESEMIVQAGRDYERSYTWDGGTRSAKLWPRKTRWYGNLGIYFPGAGQHWKSNNGITRGVLQEGVLWFKAEEDALNWLNNVQSLDNCVYTSSGIVVAWERVPARKQINVNVWQLMIGGKKPTALTGSRDEQIRVTHATQ